MEVSSAEIGKILEALAATPKQIKDLSQGLDTSQLHYRSAEQPWSANDILAHLRACADVWGKSIQSMISQQHPTLRYISPRTYIRKTNYPEQDFYASLQAFTEQRSALLETLKALSNSDWLRGATFTATVRGREHTIWSYAQRIIAHENEHCVQIEELLKKNRD